MSLLQGRFKWDLGGPETILCRLGCKKSCFDFWLIVAIYQFREVDSRVLGTHRAGERNGTYQRGVWGSWGSSNFLLIYSTPLLPPTPCHLAGRRQGLWVLGGCAQLSPLLCWTSFSSLSSFPFYLSWSIR